MTSKALDFVTIGYALEAAAAERSVGKDGWKGLNPEQERFLAWFAAHKDELSQLTDLTAKVSDNPDELNAKLREHGFPDMFGDLPDDGFGVVSILDMLIEWLEECQVRTLVVRGVGDAGVPKQTYPAFEVPRSGTTVYEVNGFTEPLVQLRTKTGHSLWLMKHAEPQSGLDLAELVQTLAEAVQVPTYRYDNVVVPKLELEPEVDVEWLTGLETTDGDWYVDEAFQLFKLRANEKGARVKVATGLTIRATSIHIEQPYYFDEPFVGFFTQPGHDRLALAGFWADTDSWREPEGTLEEL